MSKAIQAARKQSKRGPAFQYGTCALQVRTLYGIASSGDADHDGDADVLDVWEKAQGRHILKVSDFEKGIILPREVPILFAGGSAGHGHIGVTTGYGKGWEGNLWSPDTTRSGFFDIVEVERVLSWMSNGRLLGWIEIMNGVRVFDPSIQPDHK